MSERESVSFYFLPYPFRSSLPIHDFIQILYKHGLASYMNKESIFFFYCGIYILHFLFPSSFFQFSYLLRFVFHIFISFSSFLQFYYLLPFFFCALLLLTPFLQLFFHLPPPSRHHSPPPFYCFLTFYLYSFTSAFPSPFSRFLIFYFSSFSPSSPLPTFTCFLTSYLYSFTQLFLPWLQSRVFESLST